MNFQLHKSIFAAKLQNSRTPTLPLQQKKVSTNLQKVEKFITHELQTSNFELQNFCVAGEVFAATNFQLSTFCTRELWTFCVVGEVFRSCSWQSWEVYFVNSQTRNFQTFSNFIFFTHELETFFTHKFRISLACLRQTLVSGKYRSFTNFISVAKLETFKLLSTCELGSFSHSSISTLVYL